MVFKTRLAAGVIGAPIQTQMVGPSISDVAGSGADLTILDASMQDYVTLLLVWGSWCKNCTGRPGAMA